jgi:hypothetical protein
MIERYVEIDALRRVYARFQESGSHRDAMTIWKALTLALWLEQASHATEPIVS